MEKAAEEIIQENLTLLPGLSSLTTALGKNCIALEEGRAEFAPQLKSFLFEFNQRFLLTVSDGEVVPELIDMKEEASEKSQLNVEKEGSIGTLLVDATFERKPLKVKKKKSRTANVLDLQYKLCQCVPYELLFKAVGDILRNICSSEKLGEDGIRSFPETLLHLFEKLFPELYRFVGTLVDLSNLNIKLDHLEGAFLINISGDVNEEGLKEHYPALLLYLEHLADITLRAICQPREDLTIEGEDWVKYAETADFGFEFNLVTKGHHTTFDLTLAPADGTGSLLWMDSETRKPKLGRKWGFCLDEQNSFLASINMKLKIPQLCGAFSLPTILIGINYLPRSDGIEGVLLSSGFRINLIHLGKESWFTRLVSKPFYSLLALHELMENDFFVKIQTESSIESSGLKLRLQLPLPPPPKIFSGCLSIFVKRALAKPGQLMVFGYLFQAAGKDFADLYAKYQIDR